MRIFFLISSLSSGGAERVTANLANYWAGKGREVSVVTLSSEAEDFYELHPAVKRVALHLKKESANPFTAIVNNLRRVLALRLLLRQIKPDVAVAMMPAANIQLTLAAIGLAGIATIGAERCHPPQLPLAAAWAVLRVRTYGLLNAVVALTEESAAWLRQNVNVKNVVVIPNAATWPLIEQEPRLKLPALSMDSRVILAVGRLSEEKQFDLLINVFSRVSSHFPNWMLVILGEGPNRSSLEDQIKSIGLVDRILLPGCAGNMRRWYELGSLFVMTSRFEGFPNALAEAMAHGLPAVSFDCDTGPRDIIRHEVDGLLVPSGDSDALERALERMMSDEQLRRRFGKVAIEARERFSLERITGMWEQLFEEVTCSANTKTK